MKNRSQFKKFILAFGLFLYTSICFYEIQAADVPLSDLEKALTLTQLDTTVGCNLLGNMGDSVSSLNSSKKATACIVCGDKWSQDEKNRNKALTAACGGLGSPAAKQKDLLTQALSNCDNLASLSNHFDLLTPEQRIKAAKACLSQWDKFPKAQKALISVIKTDDIDESKQAIIGTIPTWPEVLQALTLAKASPKGQVTTDITQEEYNAVTKKKS